MKNLILIILLLFPFVGFSQLQIECVPFENNPFSTSDEFAGLQIVDPTTADTLQFEFPYYTYVFGNEFAIIEGNDTTNQITFNYSDVSTFGGQSPSSVVSLRNDIEECMKQWVCDVLGGGGVNNFNMSTLITIISNDTTGLFSPTVEISTTTFTTTNGVTINEGDCYLQLPNGQTWAEKPDYQEVCGLTETLTNPPLIWPSSNNYDQTLTPEEDGTFSFSYYASEVGSAAGSEIEFTIGTSPGGSDIFSSAGENLTSTNLIETETLDLLAGVTYYITSSVSAGSYGNDIGFCFNELEEFTQITYGMDYTADSTQICFYQDSVGIKESLTCFNCLGGGGSTQGPPGADGGIIINNGNDTYTYISDSTTFIIDNTKGEFVPNSDSTFVWIDASGDSLFTFQPCLTCGSGSDFEIMGLGTAFVVDDEIQTQIFYDTIYFIEGNTIAPFSIIDIDHSLNPTGNEHHHYITESGTTGGWEIDNDGLRTTGSMVYEDSYRDTITTDGGYFDARLINHRAVIIDNLTTEIDINAIGGKPGQEFIIHNGGERDINLIGPNENGFIGGNRGHNYVLPPTTYAIIRVANGSDGAGKDVIAGTGFWERSSDVVYRPDQGNIGVFPTSLPVINVNSFCDNQHFMGAGITGGSTIHSIPDCGDGFIGSLQNTSPVNDIILPTNSPTGTGIKWAPGTDYTLPAGRVVMYRINAFTGFAHIYDND